MTLIFVEFKANIINADDICTGSYEIFTCYLTAKSKTIYEKMLKNVEEILHKYDYELNVDGLGLMCDDEDGLISSFNSKWGLEHHLCNFHFNQGNW